MTKKVKKEINSSLAFIGLSHVGLVCSVSFASLKNNCLGLDTDKKIIQALNEGKLPVYEPGLDELFKKNIDRLSFSSDFSKISNCNLIFITHDTELTGNNRLKKLNLLIDEMIPHLRRNCAIVLMSQVPVGYCRQFQNKIKKIRPKLVFDLVHWIDTIIMTQAVQSFLSPSRITLGFNKIPYEIPPLLGDVLKHFDCPIVKMSWESAEITKASTNVYLATSVTFANTISDLCETTGANMSEVVPALRLDRRIGQFAYLRPSPRIAGGHIERDLEMFKKIAKEKKIKIDLIDCISKTNENRFMWVVNKIKNLKLKHKSNICIWGLAYKKDSDSTLNAPSLKIINTLKKNFNIKAYDPLAKISSEKGVVQYKDKYEALKNSDCLVILTEWDEFVKAKVEEMSRLMRGKNIIDCTGLILNPKKSKNNFSLDVMGVGKDV